MKRERVSTEKIPTKSILENTDSLNKNNVRTEDLLSNKIGGLLEEINSKAVDYQFIAGFDTKYRIGYINQPKSIVLYRKCEIDTEDGFEYDEVVPMLNLNLLNIKPHFLKYEDNLKVIYFDQKNLHIYSAFTNDQYLSFPVIQDDAIIESISEINNEEGLIELVTLDSSGRVFNIKIDKDLVIKIFVIQEKACYRKSLLSGMMSLFTAKQEPNKLKNQIFTLRNEKDNHLLKFFGNTVSEMIISQANGYSRSRKTINLPSQIRTWEHEFISKNKLIHNETKIVSYLPLFFEADKTSFLCVYNMFMTNMEEQNIIITKARIITYDFDELRSLNCIILKERPGNQYEEVHVQCFEGTDELFFALVHYSVSDNTLYNDILRTDKELDHYVIGATSERVFGAGMLESLEEEDKHFFIINTNKILYFEEIGTVDFIKQKNNEQPSMSHSIKKKVLLSSEKKNFDLSRNEIDFEKYMNELFTLHLLQDHDLEYEECETRVIELMIESDLSNEINSFIFKTLEDESRNIVMATRVDRENLGTVKKIKDRFGSFDDVITVELKRKNEKMVKLEELLDKVDINKTYTHFKPKFIAIRESITTALQIRLSQRNSCDNEFIAELYEDVLKKILDDRKVEELNTDHFYTNIVNVHVFFDYYNKQIEDLIDGPVCDPEDLKNVFNGCVSTLNKILSELTELGELYPTHKKHASLLIRNDKNLLLFISKFIKLSTKQGFSLEKQEYEQFIEKTLLYIYKMDDKLVLYNIQELKENLYMFLVEQELSEKGFEIAKQ